MGELEQDVEKREAGKLLLIKVLHTAIWVFFVFLIMYILYSGIADKINLFTWIAIALIVVEGIVLAVNKWRCPLTNVAEKYTDNHDVNFDIFLPSWLAKHNKIIFTTIYILGIIIVIYRLF